LLHAYSFQRQRQALSSVSLPKRNVWSLAEARATLERLIGRAGEWTQLDLFLIEYVVEPAMRATVFASSFSASLELVREGSIDVQQDAAFSPIWLRRRNQDRPTNVEKTS
jgi:segregation and condensation protein A